MTLFVEEWKPVFGWEERYEVSNLGRVRTLGFVDPRHAGKIIKVRHDGSGYPVVRFYKNMRAFDRTIHSLVAEAFMGPRPEGLVINHIDGVKSNPHPSNLDYVTVAENNRHAFEIIGREAVGRKLSPDGVRFVRRMDGILSRKELAERFDVTTVCIGCIQTWRTYRDVA